MSVPQPVDEAVGRLVLRSRVGGHEDDRHRTCVVDVRLARRGDALDALDVVVDSLRRLLVAVQVDDDRDRSVEARTEAFCEKVVRTAARLLLRLRSLIGGSQSHEGRRRGKSQDDKQHDGKHEPCVPRDEPPPPTGKALRPTCFGVVERTQERNLQAVDLVAEEREDGRQERARDQHGREDAEGAANTELRDEVEPEEGQPADRDGNRHAGEDHRATCGGAGLGSGVPRREPLVEQLAKARDDEKRVVDPDPEADHRDEDRRDCVDVGQAGEDEEQQERRPYRRDREPDRDDHRDEGAEEDE